MLRMRWLGLIVGLWLVAEGMYPSEPAWARRKNCDGKRQSCLSRCASQARKKEKQCRRSADRRRAECLRESHSKGRRCIKGRSCPDAENCYKECRRKADFVACSAKEKCPQKRADCYSACQLPLGQALRQCLDETEAQRKNCNKSSTDWQINCQNSCPSCP